LKAIIALNELMPPKNGNVWVTRKEITSRLVHCGVNPSLEPIEISHAINFIIVAVDLSDGWIDT